MSRPLLGRIHQHHLGYTLLAFVSDQWGTVEPRGAEPQSPCVKVCFLFILWKLKATRISQGNQRIAVSLVQIPISFITFSVPSRVYLDTFRVLGYGIVNRRSLSLFLLIILLPNDNRLAGLRGRKDEHLTSRTVARIWPTLRNMAPGQSDTTMVR